MLNEHDLVARDTIILILGAMNNLFHSIHHVITYIFILEWTTSLDFICEDVGMCVHVSMSRRTSSYVITSDCY